jgi:hypothetical protein
MKMSKIPLPCPSRKSAPTALTHAWENVGCDSRSSKHTLSPPTIHYISSKAQRSALWSYGRHEDYALLTRVHKSRAAMPLILARISIAKLPQSRMMILIIACRTPFEGFRMPLERCTSHPSQTAQGDRQTTDVADISLSTNCFWANQATMES